MSWLDDTIKHFKRRYFHKPGVIGIALSGGAIRGVAHVGVLKVLEEAGISPEIVVGTSAGAIFGAAYAAGIPLDELSKIMQDMSWQRLAEIRLNFKSILGVFNTEPLEEQIDDIIGGRTFGQLKKQFAAVATDLKTGEKVVLAEGQVSKAVRASAAFPGLFAPVELGGKLLTDGGVVENLPVQTARDLGADFVIGVDISALNVSSMILNNPFDVLFQIDNIRASHLYPSKRSYDFLIAPPTGCYSGWDFTRLQEIEDCGKEEAQKLLPALKRELGMN